MQQQLIRALLHALSACALLTAARAAAEPSDPDIAECLASYERSVTLRTAHALRAARGALLTCAAPTCPADVRNECALRVSEVNSQIPTLVFEALDHERNDLSAVKVSMDDQPLAEKLDGSALSVDPGEHRFVFEVAGSPAVEKRLVIREGQKDRRERVVLGPEPLRAPEPDHIAVPLQPLHEPEPKTGDSAKRVIGAVITAVGVAGLSVALYEQVVARRRYAESQRAAQSQDLGTRATTHALYEQAEHAQTFALISGGLGVAAAATGAYLLVSSMLEDGTESAPRTGARLSPWFAAAGGGLSCKGKF